MRFDVVGLTEPQIDATAVGFYSGNARTEMFVGICDPLVICLAILILFGIRIRISMVPKDGDELLTLFVCLKFLPGFQFVRPDNRLNVLYPLFESLRRLLLDLARLVVRISGNWLPESWGNDNENKRTENQESKRKVSQHGGISFGRCEPVD